MIIYNVTVKIENETHAEWLAWMQDTHIPDVMKTGCFSKNKMMRLIDPPSDEQGVTYALQYFCDSMETLQDYWKNFAPALQADHNERYKGRSVAFRTVLQQV